MLYLNKTTHTFFLMSTIILLLLIDLGQFFWVGTTIIPLLFCLYCVLLVYHSPSSLLACIALLQCLEYFCFYNFFSLACLYIIPITGLALFFRKNLYPSYAHIIVLSLMGITLQIYAVEGNLIHIWPTNCYTIIRIGGTLLTIMIFSLTINIWGIQDNRT